MAQQKMQTENTGLARQTQAFFKLNGAATPQLEQFWNMQDCMLEEAESFTRHWFERRHEATKKAVEVLTEINATGQPDPVLAMQAISNWQQGSAERLNADLQDWIALCAHLTQAHATSRDKEAVPSR